MATFRQQFVQLGEAGPFEPIDPKELDLRICGGGKLVDCLTRVWEPALRTVRQADGVVKMRYPIKVARLGGEIRIVL